MVRAPDPRLLEFLSAYDAPIGGVALGLREIVLEEAPEAIEAIYDAYNAVSVGFSFTGRLKDSFLHIASYARHVNLGFNRGASLADPGKVLAGTGNQIRHVKFLPGSDLDRPWLRQYIRAAIEQVGGHPAVAPAGEKSVVRGNYPVKRRPRKIT